jgi:ABC-type Fe3+-hydroxamate transport system substrate-binding protein
MKVSSKKLLAKIVSVLYIDFVMLLTQEIRRISNVTNAEKATKLIVAFANQKMAF